jgi:hypothetical protein
MYCTLYASYRVLQTPYVLYTLCQLSWLTNTWCTVHCMPVIVSYKHLMYCTLYASYRVLQTPDVQNTVCLLLDLIDSCCTLLRSRYALQMVDVQ